jgi:hypothetical protein
MHSLGEVSLVETSLDEMPRLEMDMTLGGVINGIRAVSQRRFLQIHSA